MATLGSPGPTPSRPGADNDIYTVLVIIGFVSLLVATFYLGYKTQSYFGTLWPPGGS